MNILTRPEIKGSIATGAELLPHSSLPDPREWCDLVEQPEAATKLVRQRLSDNRTPLVAQVVRWPKETGGYRPMVWLDPIDQVIFRGVVGRLIPGIRTHVDDTVVMSSRLEEGPPRWRLAHWRAQTGERRQKGLELLEEYPVLGVIDIKNFYPSVSLDVLTRVFGKMPLDPRTFEFLLGWLGQLAGTYSAPGLPTGHDPSRMLADGLLVDCDRTLTQLGIPFMRYVDDTWFFLREIHEFDPVIEKYREALTTVGLEIHPDKTDWYAGDDAINEIENFAIAYFGDVLNSPGPEGQKAALQLFEYALEHLPARKAELRRSINALMSNPSIRLIEALRADLELLRYAPDQWCRYLHLLTHQKKTRRAVDDDWLVEQTVGHWNSKDEMYKSLISLRAMDGLQLTRDRGRMIGDLTHSREGWLAPIRVWAAHVWGSSHAYSPNGAVELVEASGDYSTRRALALTLDKRPNSKKKAVWLNRLGRLDAELEPTIQWLDAR